MKGVVYGSTIEWKEYENGNWTGMIFHAEMAPDGLAFEGGHSTGVGMLIGKWIDMCMDILMEETTG